MPGLDYEEESNPWPGIRSKLEKTSGMKMTIRPDIRPYYSSMFRHDRLMPSEAKEVVSKQLDE